VILVEDDQANRRRIREILTGEGIAVVGEASDGATGVELAQEVRPDVVLMDLRMPIMGGLEATREIKNSLPLTQVIVLTSYDGPLPARSAEQAGAYAYLVKGCPGDLMRDVIMQAWKYKTGLESEQVNEVQAEGGLAAGLFGDAGFGSAPASFWTPTGAAAMADPLAEFSRSAEPLIPTDPMPDRVPEDFVQRFGREARHAVRYRASRRYRWGRQARTSLGQFKDREVWTVAIIVFGLSIFVLALAGALSYMVVLWPWTGLFIVAPVVILLPFSLWMGTRVVRKEREDQSRSFLSDW
jgi:DNA-binding NarL/FixJ family response regulator